MTMENHATPPRPAAPWLKVALALSLAANLLIVGIFIGGALNQNRPGPNAPQAPANTTARLLRELGLAPFIAAFPADIRRQMARDLRARAGPLRADREQLLSELEQILTLLRGAPFDATALSAVLEAQKQRLNRRAEIGRQVMVEAISGLTPAQRADLADRFEASIRRARERAESRAMSAPLRP